MGDLRDDLTAADDALWLAVRGAVVSADARARADGWDRASVKETTDAVLAVLAGREAAAVAARARVRALAAGWDNDSWTRRDPNEGDLYRMFAADLRRALDGAGDEPRPEDDEDGIEVSHVMTADGCKVSYNGQGHMPCALHPAEPTGDEPPTEPHEEQPWT